MKLIVNFFLFLLFICPLNKMICQNVGIGTTTPHESAALQIKSFDKGLLIPSMSTQDRLNINQPAYGLFVFDEFEETLYWRDSTEWIPILASNIGLVDIDKDTRISVEEQPDEDIIRFYTAGQEGLRYNGKGLEILNNGESVFIGALAGQQDDLSANKNVFVGFRAGESNVGGTQNIAIGHQALNFNISTSNNIAMGQQALQKNLAANNIGMGLFAARDNSTGTKNIAIGNFAGFINQTGNENTIIGYEAGRGSSNTNISGSVMLGHQAGKNETRSNTLYIANDETSSPLLYGEFDSALVRVNGGLQINDPSINGFELPEVDGADGQVLKTNGNGIVNWASDNNAGGSSNNTPCCDSIYEPFEPITSQPLKFYLKIPTIDGDSQDANHVDEIELVGFDFNLKFLSQDNCDNFKILVRKQLDKSSPKLMEAIHEGDILSDIVLSQDAIDGAGFSYTQLAVEIDQIIIKSADQQIIYRGSGQYIIYEEIELELIKGLKYTFTTLNETTGSPAQTIEFNVPTCN